MIGQTLGSITNAKTTLDDNEILKTTLQYMWGVRDSYDEFISKYLPDLVPVETPNNPEMRRVLWAISAVIDPYARLLKEKDRAIDMEGVASLSVSIIVKLTRDALGDDTAGRVIRAFKDSVEIEALNFEKGEGAGKDGNNSNKA